MKLINALSASVFSLALVAGSSAFAGGHAMKSHGTSMDLVNTAISAPDFDTLVAALDAAGLVGLLKGDGPYTVFAPTDAAFEKIPAATLNGLLGDRAALMKVLGLHIIDGKVMAEDVVGLSEAATVTGSMIGIEVHGGVVYVNNARVIATDVETANGVIHVVDAVIAE